MHIHSDKNTHNIFLSGFTNAFIKPSPYNNDTVIIVDNPNDKKILTLQNLMVLMNNNTDDNETFTIKQSRNGKLKFYHHVVNEKKKQIHIDDLNNDYTIYQYLNDLENNSVDINENILLIYQTANFIHKYQRAPSSFKSSSVNSSGKGLKYYDTFVRICTNKITIDYLKPLLVGFKYFHNRCNEYISGQKIFNRDTN